jgi:hypothetical protein
MAERLPAVIRRALSGHVARWAAILSLSVGATTRAALAQTVVVRRADIERAGWNRVTEILDGAVGWARASVDGFAYAASPDRLPAVGESGPSTPQWIVVVDGQRVPASLFGAQLLELLPVSVAQIDSVVFTRGPVIQAGTPVARGMMSIYSRRPHPGMSGELTYQHGDESGDPGPYRYTDLSSPNVEKIGPFAHAGVGWGGRSWDADAGVHLASLNVTDTLISTRFPASTFARVRQDVFSVTPTFRAGVEAFGGRHEVLAGYGEQRGLLFIPTERHEQSLRTTSGYVGASGSFVAGSTMFTYEGSSSLLDAGELASPLAFTVGHTRRHLGGTMSASRAAGTSTLTVGVTGDRWTLAADALSGSVTSSGGGPFARVVVPVGVATIDGNAALISDGGRGTSLDASIQASFRVDSMTSIAIHGSRVQSHRNMDGAWIDAFMLGYQLPAGAPTFSAVGVSVARRFVPFVAATFELRAEHVTDWAGLSVARAAPFASPPDSLTHHATLFGVHARVETLGQSVWQGSLEYDRTTASGLDGAVFGVEIESTPVDDFRAQLSSAPIRDFRLSGILALTSGTQWAAFATTANAGTTPPLRRVDASMEKWMWQRRLRLELLYRNLLNEPERTHPFGAQWNLRWHVSASLSF